MNILVLCTGNSARSILLEHILNERSEGRITAYSAGSHPAGKVHPQSLVLLNTLGFDTSHARSKSWDEFALDGSPQMDAVITVCDSAAAEICPIWPGAPVQSHWGVGDPAAVPEDAWEPAFEEAFATLAHRAKLLLDQDIESMDRQTLKAHLDHIGTLP